MNQNSNSLKEKENNKDGNTEILDSILNEEGGKQKLEMLLKEESFYAELSERDSISNKITSDHITKYLESSEKNMEKSFEDNDKQRKFILYIVVIGIVAMLIIIFMLKKEKEILNYVLTSLVSLLAGAFGGYGVGKSKNN